MPLLALGTLGSAARQMLAAKAAAEGAAGPDTFKGTGMGSAAATRPQLTRPLRMSDGGGGSEDGEAGVNQQV